MEKQLKPLIFQSDFGRADGAVSAMYGVAYSVCSELKISDLTHEIPQYDIWEASYRLIQTVSYWPEGTGVRFPWWIRASAPPEEALW